MSENVSNNNSHFDELEQFLDSFKPTGNHTKPIRKRKSVTGVITDDCVLYAIKERDDKKKSKKLNDSHTHIEVTDENHESRVTNGMMPTSCTPESVCQAEDYSRPTQQKSRNGRCLKPKIFWSPSTAGPSRIVLDSPAAISVNDIPNDDDYVDDHDVCFVCKQVPSHKDKRIVQIISWAQCIDFLCKHWVHLKYCHSLTVVKNCDVFYCPCCESEQ